MKKLGGLFIAFIMFFCPAAAFAAGLYSFPSIEEEYICAWISLAAYDDHIGLMAREELRISGWELAPHHEENKKSAPQFFLAKKAEPDGAPFYLLAITGTQSIKDIKNDLNFGKVLFGGTTPAEFQQVAETRKAKAEQPQVHGGFHQYTQTAFFTPDKDGRTIGERLAEKLRENPQARLCLTGHSLGGASAVLLSARLYAMGIPREQVEVVSFGAPAVGNKAFCELCRDMKHDRVIIAGDVVQWILQSLKAGYDDAAKLNTWRRNRNAEIFRHSMTVYLDAAMRLFYEKYAAFPPQAAGGADIYAIVKADLCPALREDKPYMERAVMHYLQRILRGRVLFAEQPGLSWREQLKAARAAGCHYVMTLDFTGRPIKDRRNVYSVELQESIYDDTGNLLGGFGATTSNKSMTPIEAALYDAVYPRETRLQLLGDEKLPAEQPKQ